MRELILNASLPCSGSEVFQVLLHQNPEIYGSTTSPLLDMLLGAGRMFATDEAKSMDSAILDSSYFGLCAAGTVGYYESVTDRPVICDKSRGWMQYYPLARSFMGTNPKLICMIRDPRQVMSSMEKTWRENMHKPLGIAEQGTTVLQRVQWLLGNMPVGLALSRIQDAIERGDAEHMLFIRYEDLCRDPESTMVQVYEYLDLPLFQHDFENIVKVLPEHDEAFGPFGKHKVDGSLREPTVDFPRILGARAAIEVRNSIPWFFERFGY